MAGLAAAFAAGGSLVHLGAPLPAAPLLLVALLLPIVPCTRPGAAGVQRRIAWAGLVAACAGALHTRAWMRSAQTDCRLLLEEGQRLSAVGRVATGPVRGRFELRVRDGLGNRCRTALRVVTTGGASPGEAPQPVAGACVRAVGEWARLNASPSNPLYAGELRGRVTDVPDECGGPSLLARRGALEGRLSVLYPERGGLVAALILARREGLDAELRETFARAGTPHLLAISGFHVGVVAALLLACVRACGVPRRPAWLVCAGAVGGTCSSSARRTRPSGPRSS